MLRVESAECLPKFPTLLVAAFRRPVISGEVLALAARVATGCPLVNAWVSNNQNLRWRGKGRNQLPE